MNHAQWLAATDPWPMLGFLERRASGRKLLLFAVACCRRALPLSDDRRHRAAIEAAERFANGAIEPVEFERALQPIVALWEQLAARSDRGPFVEMTCAARHLETPGGAKYAARFVAGALADRVFSSETPGWGAAVNAEKSVQAALLRDLFGDPSRPFAFDAKWLSGDGRTAVALAREIDERRRFDGLPPLTDVLERAGCRDSAVLDHCRTPGLHVRGCWVIDALLGREPAVRKGLTSAADWQTCEDPTPLIHFLRDRGTARQWRVFEVACCRRIDHWINDPRSRRAVDVAARHAEGVATDEELDDARSRAQDAAAEAKRREYVAEAEANFCMTPEYAKVGLELFAAQAARSAVARDPRMTDHEPGSFCARYWRPSHEWASAAWEYSVYAGMSEADGGWRSETIVNAVSLIRTADGRAQCRLLREIFHELLGPPRTEACWLPFGDRSERWCLLPMPVTREARREGVL